MYVLNLHSTASPSSCTNNEPRKLQTDHHPSTYNSLLQLTMALGLETHALLETTTVRRRRCSMGAHPKDPHNGVQWVLATSNRVLVTNKVRTHPKDRMGQVLACTINNSRWGMEDTTTIEEVVQEQGFAQDCWVLWPAVVVLIC